MTLIKGSAWRSTQKGERAMIGRKQVDIGRKEVEKRSKKLTVKIEDDWSQHYLFAITACQVIYTKKYFMTKIYITISLVLPIIGRNHVAKTEFHGISF